jgi:biotin synthase
MCTADEAGRPGREDMIRWLKTADKAATERLFEAARRVRIAEVGPGVHLRGLIEFSNECVRNCRYCGIRRGNRQVERYRLTEDQIAACARLAKEAGYGSVVLQSGERTDERFVSFVEAAVRRVKAETGLGITLSAGEQSAAVYERWFRAGAHRYLLRIETSNPALYARLHPPDQSFDARVRCLLALREAGYQVGTGAMIGLPGQTEADMADDILFYESVDADMIGMGPYVTHRDTPLAGEARRDSADRLRLALTMIALARLRLRDVNIAAATALQALHPEGREMGLKAGANILMPNLTPARARRLYRLYDGKPCLEEGDADCGPCLERRLAAVGETIAYGGYGDSPHFARRTASAGTDRVLH